MTEYENSFPKRSQLYEDDFVILYSKGRELRLLSSPDAQQMIRDFEEALRCEKQVNNAFLCLFSPLPLRQVTFLEQAAKDFERLNSSGMCARSAPCNFVHYKYLMSSATWPRRFDLARLVERPILELLREKDPVTGRLRFKPIAQAIFRYDKHNHSRWATHEDLIRNNFVKV